MTNAARIVLEDCRQELQEFQDAMPASVWRRRWIALLVLLRAVGHVLDKVDGECSLALRREVTHWWKQLNQTKAAHPLFWEFIERERNSFIKQYDTAAHQVVAIQVGAVNYDARTGRQWSDPPMPARHFQQMASGHFAGRNPREVALEAIGWWEEQLATIHLRAKECALTS